MTGKSDHTKQRLILVCEGSRDIGFGHVSRCLAVAEAFADQGWQASFAGVFRSGAEKLLESAGVPYTQMAGCGAQQRLEAARTAMAGDAPAAIVLDHYEATESDLAAFEAIAPTLFVDDFNALASYPCTAVVNPAADLTRFTYPDDGPALFLGVPFLPVRRALRETRPGCHALDRDPAQILVTIGGADRWHLTARTVDALRSVAPTATLHVVVTDNFPDEHLVAGSLARFDSECRLIRQLPSLAAEFEWADVTVCGGGMTKYESAYLGVPPIVVSKTQEEADETLLFAARGLCIDMGYGPALSDTALAVELAAALSGTPRLCTISETALTVFPDDPTRNLVASFLNCLKA